jgi:hypothetical protein
MDILRQALLHIRAGRWDEAHTLVQSDESQRPPGCTASCTFRKATWEMPNTGTARRSGISAVRGTLEEELERFEAGLP